MNSRRRRVLVIGGAGYIGGEVCTLLSSSGVDFLIVDNFLNSAISPVECGSRGWRYVNCDITDLENIKDRITDYAPDCVVHMAAIHYIPFCNENPTETIQTNVGGLRNVLAAVKLLKNEPEFIFISSAAVYSGKEQKCQELDALEPSDIYGLTKYAGEMLVKSSLRNYRIVRFFNAFGKRDSYPHLLSKIYQAAIDQEELQLGAADSRRDYVHVSDIARAVCLLLDYRGSERIFNIGTGYTLSVKEVVEAFEKKFDRPLNASYLRPEHLRKNDKPVLCADISRIHRELEWSPEYSFMQGLDTLC